MHTKGQLINFVLMKIVAMATVFIDFLLLCGFYPTVLKGLVVGLLFSPMVFGWAGGGWKVFRAVPQKP